MRVGVLVDGQDPAAFGRVRALGASAISMPVRPGQDQTAFLKVARTAHRLAVLGVLDRASFRATLDWRGSADADIDWVMNLVEGGYLDALAIGHEPDDGFRQGQSDNPLVAPRGGVGSWAMPLAELAELIALLRARMREVPFPIPLVLGGLCSWRVEVLDRLDLSLLDGILIHPYGMAMEPEAALGIYLNSLVQVLADRGLTDRVRLGVGELGRFDQGHGRGQIADWFGRSLSYLSSRGDVDCTFICCDSDLTLDGFGQYDVRERAKPSVASIFEISQRLPTEDPLFRITRETPEQETSPGPEDEPSWNEPCFTVGQAADALVRVELGQGARPSLLAPLRRLWGAIQPTFAQLDVPEELAPRAALLAAIYVATAGRLTPLIEGGSYARSEHRYGDVLGNHYHGDGHRYRGRGLLWIRGRDAYAHYQEVTGLPLLDEPDLVVEFSIAAVLAALLFSERALFAAAQRGNWTEVWRGVTPSLNGYDTFLSVVQMLHWAVDNAAPSDDSRLGPMALGAALTRIGDPYRTDGDVAGGFDALGLVTWAYGQVRELPLPTSLEALVADTVPLGEQQLRPGDLVVYEYGDAASGGARYDHVALAVDATLVLDARYGAGVGYRPHVRGALRRYRRVPGVPKLGPEEGAATDWQTERAEILRQRDVLVEQIQAIRQRWTERRPLPEPPVDRAPKAKWLAWGQAVSRWRERDNADRALHETALERFAQDLDRLGVPPDLPEAPEEETHGDDTEALPPGPVRGTDPPPS